MRKLKKEDELLIQNKINGPLSAKDEERFIKLIETSTKASHIYRDLLDINHLLESDVKNGKTIDFAKEIMEKIKEKSSFKKISIKSSRNKILSIRSNLLAYAAILLLGLIIGSVATYLVDNQGQLPDASDISGTISSKNNQDFRYSQEGTQIIIKELHTDWINLTTIVVHTEDTIQGRISGLNSAFYMKNISSTQTGGVCNFINENQGDYFYEFYGDIVLQMSFDRFETPNNELAIQFSKNNEEIVQKEIGKRKH